MNIITVKKLLMKEWYTNLYHNIINCSCGLSVPWILWSIYTTLHSGTTRVCSTCEFVVMYVCLQQHI